ncbi:MAG TPA: sugar phosphate isomerase/epimerase [Acidimicrobiia bacterium]|nr:sugar phosphate isomerase/epimerase [Acidimicrobiia bacterium]
MTNTPPAERVAVSAISTFALDLAGDLEFWSRHGIDLVGVSVAKLERFGWRDGTNRIADAIADGLRVCDLIGLSPFDLAHPERWEQQRERVVQSIECAATLAVPLIVFTTGPFAPLRWTEAADAFEAALAPVLAEARRRNIAFAIEHTNSLRVDVGFVHTLRDALDLADRLDVGVCLEMNACWAERDLDDTIRRGVDRVSLVQVSDFKVGTIASSQRLVPGDGDIPLRRLLETLLAAGYRGVFELELIGDAIKQEGYDAAVPRAIAALRALLRPT